MPHLRPGYEGSGSCTHPAQDARRLQSVQRLAGHPSSGMVTVKGVIALVEEV